MAWDKCFLLKSRQSFELSSWSQTSLTKMGASLFVVFWSNHCQAIGAIIKCHISFRANFLQLLHSKSFPVVWLCLLHDHDIVSQHSTPLLWGCNGTIHLWGNQTQAKQPRHQHPQLRKPKPPDIPYKPQFTPDQLNMNQLVNVTVTTTWGAEEGS